MDNVDIELLAALEADGRQSFSVLAQNAGLSKTSGWARVQNLEKTGALVGYRAVIDPAALGLNVTAYVQIEIAAGMRDAFERAVMANHSIVECTTMAGDADYMLKVICKDVARLDELLRYNLSLLPGVESSTTLICLKTIKQNGSITNALKSRSTYTGSSRSHPSNS